MFLNTLVVFRRGCCQIFTMRSDFFSLTITFKYGLKDSCSENFVTYAEKCPWESLLKEATLCRFSGFLNKVLYKMWFLRHS